MPRALWTLHTLKTSTEDREEKTPCLNESVSPCCVRLPLILQRGRIYSQLEVWFKERGLSDWETQQEWCWFQLSNLKRHDATILMVFYFSTVVREESMPRIVSVLHRKWWLETGTSRCFPAEWGKCLWNSSGGCPIENHHACTCLALCLNMMSTRVGEHCPSRKMTYQVLYKINYVIQVEGNICWKHNLKNKKTVWNILYIHFVYFIYYAEATLHAFKLELFVHACVYSLLACYWRNYSLEKVESISQFWLNMFCHMSHGFLHF